MDILQKLVDQNPEDNASASMKEEIKNDALWKKGGFFTWLSHQFHKEGFLYWLRWFLPKAIKSLVVDVVWALLKWIFYDCICDVPKKASAVWSFLAKKVIKRPAAPGSNDVEQQREATTATATTAKATATAAALAPPPATASQQPCEDLDDALAGSSTGRSGNDGVDSPKYVATMRKVSNRSSSDQQVGN